MINIRNRLLKKPPVIFGCVIDTILTFTSTLYTIIAATRCNNCSAFLYAFSMINNAVSWFSLLCFICCKTERAFKIYLTRLLSQCCIWIGYSLFAVVIMACTYFKNTCILDNVINPMIKQITMNSSKLLAGNKDFEVENNFAVILLIGTLTLINAYGGFVLYLCVQYKTKRRRKMRGEEESVLL